MFLITLTPKKKNRRIVLLNPDKIAFVTDAPENCSLVTLDFPGIGEPLYTVEVIESPESIRRIIERANGKD